MSIEIADAYVAVYARMPNVEKDITSAVDGASRSVEKSGTSAGSAYGKGFQGAAAGFMASAGALFIANKVGDFVAESLQSLARIDTINTQTRSVIESTGGAAGVTAEHVEALAGKLENLTATEAESTQEGANLLLTFKNIQNGVGEGNDIFDQATSSLVDMARAMGTDPSAAAIQLGKALNDPIAGISALSRVGIQFTDDQKSMIESMVEAGDVAGAQKIILGELNSQFGGSGEAYASSYSGQLDLLGHSFGTLGETVLSAVMPVMKDLMAVLVPMFQWLGENPAVVQLLAVAVGILAAAFVALSIAMWAASLTPIGLLITAIVVGVGLLIAAIVALLMNWDQVVAWMTTVWSGFVSWITGVIEGFVGWWNGIWSAVGSFISDVWRNFTLGLQVIWQGYVNWITGVVVGLINWWNGIWGGVGKVIETVFGGIGSFVSGIFDGIISTIRGAINVVIDVINGAIRGVNGVIGTVGAAIGIDVSVPTIPRLAEGGIIAARPGGIVANIGEGRYDEAVIPLSPSVLGALGGGGGSKTVNQYITTQQDDPRIQARMWGREAERAFAST